VPLFVDGPCLPCVCCVSCVCCLLPAVQVGCQLHICQPVNQRCHISATFAPHAACIVVCRWDANYEAVSLADIPHRRLTKPCKVFEHWFDGAERKARGRWAGAEQDAAVRGGVA